MALDKPMREQPLTSKGDIVVGDDVWIGFGAVILESSNIGDGAVVAAGAVVRGDVPPYAIVAGVPAKVVGSRKDRV
jgi:acetyltransferase-like isoleucine patch superfamily enzyme